MRTRALAVLAVVAAGCTDDLDPPWQLDHDRIVAVRADPPRLMPTATAELAVLLAHAGAPTSTQAPDAVVVTSPATPVAAIAGATVTAGDAAALAAARRELGLAADAPVPLVLELHAGGFAARTTVWLGVAGADPTLDGLAIAGQPPGAALAIPAGTDVPLAIDASDETAAVTWLTSCGTLHDFDLAHAFLRVEPGDPQAGELAVVVRDLAGGASWRVWPIAAVDQRAR